MPGEHVRESAERGRRWTALVRTMDVRSETQGARQKSNKHVVLPRWPKGQHLGSDTTFRNLLSRVNTAFDTTRSKPSLQYGGAHRFE